MSKKVRFKTLRELIIRVNMSHQGIGADDEEAESSREERNLLLMAASEQASLRPPLSRRIPPFRLLTT